MVTTLTPVSVLPVQDQPIHPCLKCGACCAYFRASFYWSEADDASPGGVPVEMTQQLTPHLRVMVGTNQAKPRCTALDGVIGQQVLCRIHPQRSSTCRDFAASFEDGTHNPRCDSARSAYGLPPLTPADWVSEPGDNQPEPPQWPRVA